MGRPDKPIIDPVKLMHMRNVEGKSRPECAQFFGTTIEGIKAAEKRISRRLNKLPVPAGNSTIDSMKQLGQINEEIVSQLKRCNKMILREEVKMEACDTVFEKLKKDPNNIDAHELMDKIWGSNNRAILAIQANLISASAEIRKQIELQLKIAETLYGLEVTEAFQNEVINIIKEVEPEAAQKIVNKLREIRSIRGLVKTSG